LLTHSSKDEQLGRMNRLERLNEKGALRDGERLEIKFYTIIKVLPLRMKLLL